MEIKEAQSISIYDGSAWIPADRCKIYGGSGWNPYSGISDGTDLYVLMQGRTTTEAVLISNYPEHSLKNEIPEGVSTWIMESYVEDISRGSFFMGFGDSDYIRGTDGMPYCKYLLMNINTIDILPMANGYVDIFLSYTGTDLLRIRKNSVDINNSTYSLVINDAVMGQFVAPRISMISKVVISLKEQIAHFTIKRQDGTEYYDLIYFTEYIGKLPVETFIIGEGTSGLFSEINFIEIYTTKREETGE